MRIVPIAFCFDNNLVAPACVALSSLMMSANADTFYDIFILHSHKQQLKHKELDKLQDYYKNCRIQYRTVGSAFDESFEIRGITTPAYYRLLIPELILEYDKILYSDVDVIFRSDLAKFYDIEIDDNYFAAVEVCTVLRPEIYNYAKNVLKIDVDKGYYYSGNLVINSKQIRSDQIIEKFKTLAGNNYLFQDLDIMNIVCNGRIKSLTPAFCLTNYFYELIITQREKVENLYSKEVISEILSHGIVHYNGAKPWKDWCYNMDIWWKCYRESIFFNEDFSYDFYKRKIGEIDSWSFLKRVKHLLRYFKK